MQRLGYECNNETWKYQHMSSHYRKILNAQKSVDTSPPRSYKPRSAPSSSPSPTRSRIRRNSCSRNVSPAQTVRTSSSSSLKDSGFMGRGKQHRSKYSESLSSLSVDLAHSDKELIDELAFDTKLGPLLYCNLKDVDVPLELCMSSRNYKSPYRPKRIQKSTSPKPKMKKKSVKRNLSQSKVNGIRIERDENILSEVQFDDYEQDDCKYQNICDNTDIKCDNGCTCHSNLKPQSQTSSRDSAYNGGVSSVPDSRSPTPDQKGSMDQNVAVFNKQKRPSNKSYSETRQEDELTTDQYRVPTNTPIQKSNSVQRSSKRVEHELLYLKLIQDITNEVLEKGLYTNKSLKKVMKKHIQANVNQLDMEKMIDEIEKLRIQLGIPKDDSENGLNFGLGPMDQPVEEKDYLLCSVISDSEFIVPPILEEDNRTINQEEEEWSSHYNILNLASKRNNVERGLETKKKDGFAENIRVTFIQSRDSIIKNTKRAQSDIEDISYDEDSSSSQSKDSNTDQVSVKNDEDDDHHSVEQLSDVTKSEDGANSQNSSCSKVDLGKTAVHKKHKKKFNKLLSCKKREESSKSQGTSQNEKKSKNNMIFYVSQFTDDPFEKTSRKELHTKSCSGLASTLNDIKENITSQRRGQSEPLERKSSIGSDYSVSSGSEDVFEEKSVEERKKYNFESGRKHNQEESDDETDCDNDDVNDNLESDRSSAEENNSKSSLINFTNKVQTTPDILKSRLKRKDSK